MVRENSYVESMKFVKSLNEDASKKETERIQEKVDKIETWKKQYNNIIHDRIQRERFHGRLLESCRNDALASSIKAIYITALENYCGLSDDETALAESIVENWVKESGGTEVILSTKNQHKSYLLARIAQIVENAAKRAVMEVEAIKEADDDTEEDEKKEDTDKQKIEEKEDEDSKEDAKEKEKAEKESPKDDDEEPVEDEPEEGDFPDEDLDKDTDNDDEEDEEPSEDEEEDYSDEIDINLDDDDEEEDTSVDYDEVETSDDGEETEESEEDIEVSDDGEGDVEVDTSETETETPDDNDDEVSKEEEDEAGKEILDDDPNEDEDDEDVTDTEDDSLDSDQMYKDLEDEEDVKKAVDTIQTRVADAEEKFIKKNAEDKKKVDELLHKINNSVKTVEEIDDDENPKSQAAQESKQMYRRQINDIANRAPKSVFESMANEISRSTYLAESVKREITDHVTEDVDTSMDAIIGKTRILYGFLETLNTLRLENVNGDYIKKVINEIN